MVSPIFLSKDGEKVKRRLKELDVDIKDGKNMGSLNIDSSFQDRIEYLLNFRKDSELKYRKLHQDFIESERRLSISTELNIRQKDEIEKLRLRNEKLRGRVTELEDDEDRGKFDDIGGK